MAVLRNLAKDEDGSKLLAVLRYISSAMATCDYKILIRLGSDFNVVFAAKIARTARRRDNKEVYVYFSYYISASRRLGGKRNYVARILVRRGALEEEPKRIVIYLHGDIVGRNEMLFIETLKKIVEIHFTIRRSRSVGVLF